MKLLIPLLFLFSFMAFAQQARVLIVDPDIDASELKDYQVDRPKLHNSLPDREEREEFLAGVEEVKDYDELQKDIFFMDIKSKSLKDLQKKYPDISPVVLKKLKGKK